jgi:starvation-inducible outer membrane lipoprotein
MLKRSLVVLGVALALTMTGCGSAPANIYPNEAIGHFLTMCQSDGNGPSLCRCFITSMERHYPYIQVQGILTANNSDAPEWDAVTKDCAGI